MTDILLSQIGES